MGKVFRLHTGANTLEGWDDANAPYGTSAINQIKDPNGATSKKEITSIPSPFARMDLVKVAFKNVTDNHQVEGDTIFHKLVSDCFDVGEIFFNIDKLSDKLRIIAWDRQNDLKVLLDSNDSQHRLLGETLKLYMEQDAQAFNFKNLQRIYLLDYIGPNRPAQMNIIGGTSPITLFFTPANNLSYVSKNICFGNDRPFDDDYQPLYERDIDYIRYWFALKNEMPEFAVLFPEVNAYLELTYQCLDGNTKDEIDKLQVGDYESLFSELSVGNVANLVEVLGFPLKKQNPVSANNFKSDFTIKSSVYKGEIKPLVLPINTYTKPNMRYVTSYWDKSLKAPITDDRLLQERILPEVGTKYPYLTIGDFLEDNIIFTGYTLNDDNFYNAGYQKDNECYLLPIRKEFFSYFTIEELKSEMPDGKKMFELSSNAGGIKATLRIPIQKGEYITYERIYFNSQPEEEENKGGIFVSEAYCIGLFPAIKFVNDQKAKYRVIISGNSSFFNSSLDFYQGCKRVDIASKSERNVDVENLASNVTYILEKNFDYVQMNIKEGISGIIVPQWKISSGSSEFIFAIDFGTSNTHIEYAIVGSKVSEPFDISYKDRQLYKLNEYLLANTIFNNDYIPAEINQSSQYHFPIRTVLSEGKNTDWKKPVFAMANTNIPFTYEKEMLPDFDKWTTELKWGNTIDSQQKVYHYLETLFLLLRNKVLLNNGELEKTKIVWFYPASMTEGRYNKYAKIWNELYKVYFGQNVFNVVPVSESLAPYSFYKNKKGATTDVVSIDIGGGTTDVLIVREGRADLLTSFRFAANSIFGDGYGLDADSNTFLQYYIKEIKEKFTANAFNELIDVLGKLDTQKVSADIFSFFFSLASNKKILESGLKIDFNELLSQDDNCRYLFILFYAAIMYHIASIMKIKKLPMPRHITFSGNGSKILQILTPSNETLENFTKLIFEKVYGVDYDIDGVTIIRNFENPKEATCKGGILNPEPQPYSDIDNLKQTLLGDGMGTFITGDIKYDAVGEKMQTDVLNEVIHFIDVFIQLNNEFSYVNKFSAEPSKWNLVKQCCEKDIKKHLKDGITQKKEELHQTGTEPKIEETLFFYPLVGILNQMAQELYK